MIRLIHPAAGTLALLTVATFWISTVVSELIGSEEAIVAVKTAIAWGLLVLIPALAAAGGTGFKLANGARTGLVGAKAKRMPFIAANGVLILIPAALFLAYKAGAGAFDSMFFAVQAIELMAGMANIILLSLNMRAGLRLTRRVRPSD